VEVTTPEKRFERDKSLARLLIIAHAQGVDAAMEEWRRLLAEKRAAEAQSSPRAGEPGAIA
jgi:hypothetical protein